MYRVEHRQLTAHRTHGAIVSNVFHCKRPRFIIPSLFGLLRKSHHDYPTELFFDLLDTRTSKSGCIVFHIAEDQKPPRCDRLGHRSYDADLVAGPIVRFESKAALTVPKNDFRYTPVSRLKSDTAACLKRAISRHRAHGGAELRWNADTFAEMHRSIAVAACEE